jgi:thioredoxin-like negative regulator of GroEL
MKQSGGEMTIKIFGKAGCQVCKQAVEKIDYFLNKWDYKGQVPIQYFDMETVDGLAEGAFYEVYEIPTVVLLKANQELDRWLKRPPLSKELKPHLDRHIKGEVGEADEE